MGMERAVYQCSTGLLCLASSSVFIGKCSGVRCTQITGFKKNVIRGKCAALTGIDSEVPAAGREAFLWAII